MYDTIVSLTLCTFHQQRKQKGVVQAEGRQGSGGKRARDGQLRGQRPGGHQGPQEREAGSEDGGVGRAFSSDWTTDREQDTEAGRDGAPREFKFWPGEPRRRGRETRRDTERNGGGEETGETGRRRRETGTE